MTIIRKFLKDKANTGPTSLTCFNFNPAFVEFHDLS